MSTIPDKRNPLDLDRERVTCLLLINAQLMKKAVNIYVNVLTNQQTMQQIPPQNKQTILELYQNCTRRIHCNLSVLSYLHEKYHTDPNQQTSTNRAQFPIIMSAPQDMPELQQLYNKLQDLYPEALQFLKVKINQMRKLSQGQPNTQQPRSASQSAQPQFNSPQIPQQMQPSPAMVNNPLLSNVANNSFQNMGPKDIPQNFMQQQLQPQQPPQGRPQSQQQMPSNFNPQPANNNYANMNMGQQLQPQQLSMQAISPQQILQQMNGTPSNNNTQSLNEPSNMDFF